MTDHRCACGCRQIVHVIPFYENRQSRFFVKREHKTRFLRARRDRTYPADAPEGSLKRAILDALRREIRERGIRQVERCE